MSMLFITHDLGIVRRIADVVCVMNSGKIVEQGPVEEVFTAPKHAYTRALLAAEPKPDPAPPRPNEPVVMSADNLKVWFPIKRGLLRSTVGHIKAVDGVSIAVRKGETLGVVGKSGSGKTTLGLALLRLISSDGPIVFLGSNIQGLRFKAMLPFRRDMQIVFQDPFGALSPRMSVGDIVAEGLTVHQKSLSYEEREARVVKALRDVGLDPATRFRYPHEFSGGQRQRISIARAVVLEPNFVVLDEPTSALDMLFQAQMVDLLRELQRKRDLTYMFISHDLRVVASLASHLIVMRHGKVVEEGPAAELFKNPKSDYTRALFAAAFRIEAVPDAMRARAGEISHDRLYRPPHSPDDPDPARHPVRVLRGRAVRPGGPVERVIAQLSGADTGATSRISGAPAAISAARRPGRRVGATPSVRNIAARRGSIRNSSRSWKQQFGFDKPAHERFLLMMWNYVRFDFGKSYFRDVSVIQPDQGEAAGLDLARPVADAPDLPDLDPARHPQGGAATARASTPGPRR